MGFMKSPVKRTSLSSGRRQFSTQNRIGSPNPSSEGKWSWLSCVMEASPRFGSWEAPKTKSVKSNGRVA